MVLAGDVGPVQGHCNSQYYNCVLAITAIMSAATKVMFDKSTDGHIGNQNRLDILVCGKTGVGKSTLINALLGNELCPVGDAAELDDDDAFRAKTQEVDATKTSVNGILLRIFDSPGLQDGTDNDQRYVDLIYDRCKDADLVFYCLEMPTARWTPREIEATLLLTNKFGPDFWKKAILVLTKANMLQPRKRMSPEEEKQYFKTTLERLATRFRNDLKKKNVPPEIADDIPAVPVGSEAVQVLQDGESYVRSLWLTCFHRVTGDAKEKFVLGTDVIYRVIPAEAYSNTAGKQLDFDEMIKRGWGAQIPKLDEMMSKLEQLHQKEEEARKREEKLQRREKDVCQREKEEAAPNERLCAIEKQLRERQQDQPPAYPIILYQKERQSVGASIAKSAVVGATVGAFLGPVGSAIGGTIGGIFGALF